MSSSRQTIRAVPDPVTDETPTVAALAPSQQIALGDRDVRAKRPPLLSFLLRWETLRRFSRVVVLMALDFAGVFLAIFTALLLKDVVHAQTRNQTVAQAFHQTRGLVAFAYLVTTLLFARSGMYADRGERPGFTRILATLFQVMVVALIFALVSGTKYLSSYYVFYGSFFFALIYLTGFRQVYEQISGLLLRAAGYRRRAVLVGTGGHIDAVAKALSAGPHPAVEVVGFVSRSPLPHNGLRSLGSLAEIGEAIEHNRVDEVIVVDPDFPERELLELVDSAHRRGVRVRIAPSTTEILVHRAEFVPGQSVPLFELRPPVLRGGRLRVEAHLRPGRRHAPGDRAEPAADRDRDRDQARLARTGAVPLDAAGDRRDALRVPEVPHDGRRRRSAPVRPRAPQRGVGRAVQDAPGSAPDPGRARPATLLAG